MKKVNNQNLWNFDLGSQECIKIPIWIIIGFQQQDRQHFQNLNNGTFCRLPVVSPQCIIGKEKYLDAGILTNYDDDDYSEGYSQKKEAFRASTKHEIFQTCISDDNFRTSNVRADDVGYNLYGFDIRYQKKFYKFSTN